MGESDVAVGSGCPGGAICVTVGAVSCVDGGSNGSALGTNSDTVPVTWTRAVKAAAAGGALDVKTNTPSDVAGLASWLASSSCRKKPFAVTPVTMPRVVTTLPTIGDDPPGPWMSWIGVSVRSSLRIVPRPCTSPAVAPTMLVTLTKNVSLGSGVTSPLTVTPKP